MLLLEELVRLSLGWLNLLLIVLPIAVPMAVGASGLIFNRQFSVYVYQYRKAVWKLGYSETDIKIGRILTVTVGTFMLIGGFAMAVERLGQ